MYLHCISSVCFYDDPPDLLDMVSDKITIQPQYDDDDDEDSDEEFTQEHGNSGTYNIFMLLMVNEKIEIIDLISKMLLCTGI